MLVCQSAVDLLNNKSIIFCDGWQTHGWILVKKNTCTNASSQLPDNYFMGADEENDDDNANTLSQTSHNIKELQHQITMEHGYDVTSKCKPRPPSSTQKLVTMRVLKNAEKGYIFQCQRGPRKRVKRGYFWISFREKGIFCMPPEIFWDANFRGKSRE